MQKSKLEYLKDIQKALKTYNEEHDTIDFSLIQKIYNHANNLDNLDMQSIQELNDFIENNTISITHLANIYLDENGKKILNKTLNKIVPFKVSKPQSHIKFIKSKESSIIKFLYQNKKVKVLCKTKQQQKAA